MQSTKTKFIFLFTLQKHVWKGFQFIRNLKVLMLGNFILSSSKIRLKQFLSDGWVASRRHSVRRSDGRQHFNTKFDTNFNTKFNTNFSTKFDTNFSTKWDPKFSPNFDAKFSTKFGLNLVLGLGCKFVLKFGLNFVQKFASYFGLKFVLNFVLKFLHTIWPKLMIARESS